MDYLRAYVIARLPPIDIIDGDRGVVHRRLIRPLAIHDLCVLSVLRQIRVLFLCVRADSIVNTNRETVDRYRQPGIISVLYLPSQDLIFCLVELRYL